MRVSKSFVRTKTYNSFRKSTSRILEIIREGQGEGVVRRDINIYILRQLILGILEHIVTRWLLKGEKYDLLEHCDEVNRLIFHGISLTKGPHELR
jgi:TetR/AcrR family fatty acid metabolism transcriptional regulator